MTSRSIQFCPYCGSPLITRPSFGAIRPVCPVCEWIHFEDPKVAVGVIVIQDNQVLLTRRIYEPAKGQWSIPAGFMNAHEHPEAAARRECLEETGLTVQVGPLLDVLSGRTHPRGADLLLVYRAFVVEGILSAGDDADRAAFFPTTQLPPLAFQFPLRLIQQAINTSPPVIE